MKTTLLFCSLAVASICHLTAADRVGTTTATSDVAAIKTTKVKTNRTLKKSGEEVALNPQPLPPSDGNSKAKFKITNKGTEASLNPQPLPPVDGNGKNKVVTAGRGQEVSLNPQPLPPSDGNSHGKSKVKKKAKTSILR